MSFHFFRIFNFLLISQFPHLLLLVCFYFFLFSFGLCSSSDYITFDDFYLLGLFLYNFIIFSGFFLSSSYSFKNFFFLFLFFFFFYSQNLYLTFSD